MSHKEDHDLLLSLKEDVKWMKYILTTFLMSDVGRFLWDVLKP